MPSFSPLYYEYCIFSIAVMESHSFACWKVVASWEKGNNGLRNNEKDYSSSVNCLSCVGSSSVTSSSQCYLFSIYDHMLVILRLASLHLNLIN